MQQSPRLTAALELAAKGIPVFPTVANGASGDAKRPAVEGGFHAATTDPDVIRGWWAQDDFNVAFTPEVAGLCVVDLDDGGEATWDALEAEHGAAPDTMTVLSPSGGYHLYFKGSLPPTVRRLGPGIDTRGGRSYVLLPPSVVEGKAYVYENSAPPALLPSWVPEVLAFRVRDKAQSAGVDLDQPQNVERAVAFLKARPEAISGQGSDERTLEAAMVLHDLGLSAERALEVMLQHYRADVKDDRFPAFLERKIENAYRYAQNEPGAWALPSSQEAFGAVLGKLPPEAESEGSDILFKIWDLGEIAQEPEPDWLIPGLIQERAVGQLFAPSESFKTFTAVALVMPIARERRVLYLAGESSRGVQRRMFAWCNMNGVDWRDVKLKVVRVMPQTAFPERGVQRFIDEVRRQGFMPDLVVVDTVARAMLGLDESSAKDAGMFVEAMTQIGVQLDTAVLLIHHTGKDAGRGGRGSSALRGGWDFELELERHENCVALYTRKQRDAEHAAPLFFEGRKVVGNLVMVPITAQTFKMMTEGDDVLAREKIGAALREMGAVGSGAGVTTHNLAIQLAGAGATEEQISIFKRSLGNAAKHKLEAYCLGQGEGRRWFIPGA